VVKRKINTTNISIVVPHEMYLLIKAITDEQQISVSEFTRRALTMLLRETDGLRLEQVTTDEKGEY